MSAKKVINFAAGPSKVPEEVMKQIEDELIHYKDAGVSVMELSHRSKTFEEIIQTAERDLRTILAVPDNYKVLFMQGGGTGQFAAVPLNLCTNRDGCTADYVVTGAWSSKAAKEAEKYCKVNYVLEKTKKYVTVPSEKEWKLSSKPCYLYYCANETIDGVEFQNIPHYPPDVPLVCDMSSNFLTRPVDVSKFGLIFAGTQKNVGIAGLVVVIVREDLLDKVSDICPAVFNYKLTSDNKSLYNTPNCFAVYVTGLCLKWIINHGGIEGMNQLSDVKSKLIYDVIDNSGDFYVSPVDARYRSRVNIPFRIGGPQGDDILEKQFLDETIKRGMIQLKGHRSVGGLRASLFNAITIEETEALANFMKDFQASHQKNGYAA